METFLMCWLCILLIIIVISSSILIFLWMEIIIKVFLQDRKIKREYVTYGDLMAKERNLKIDKYGI